SFVLYKMMVEESRPLKVAMIDSGIDSGFQHSKVTSINFINQNEDAVDELGHGLFVADAIFKDLDNEFRNQIVFYNLKVINSDGKAKLSNVIEAIEKCIEEKVDIINISCGFSRGDEKLKATIDKAIENDIIIVAAAGNKFGMNADYPARYSKVISVASINTDGESSKFNAVGKIDFTALGEANSGERSGTSFSAPIVTNKILQRFEETGDLENYDEIMRFLKKSTSEKNNKKVYGNGIIE
ncbi:hypothetical protein EQB18_15130, partial [Listeria monocytogenes]|nr:hypothetical protein [Listeria monocytogenes]